MEKGWAALVDVVVGGLDGEEVGVEVVRGRVKDGRMRNAEARLRHR